MTEQRFTWLVPLCHPAFAGHFPGNPILPGVVLLDRALLCVQAAVDADEGEGKSAGVGWTVSQSKFLSPVGPGEALDFALTPNVRGGWRFNVQGADGRAVASGSLTAQQA